MEGDTRCVAYTFLADMKAVVVCDEHMRALSLPYLGHPPVVRMDGGSNFVATGMQQWAGEAGIVLHTVPVDHPSAMSLGEQIHEPIKKVFQKHRLKNLRVSGELFLEVVVKRHVDSSGINGVVPTVVIYGAFPRLPTCRSRTGFNPQ